MVFYDWVVSLPREVDLFITHKSKPLSTGLYLVNKYTNIGSQVVQMVAYAPLSPEVCLHSTQ